MSRAVPIEVEALPEALLITLRQGCFAHLTRAADKRHLVELPDNAIRQRDRGASNHVFALDHGRKKS